MKLNYKLFFKYILFSVTNTFLNYKNKNDKNLNIYIKSKYLYYTVTHFKLSSLFYSTQLVELFAYETQINSNINQEKNLEIINFPTNVLVYNFHNILANQRVFAFTSSNTNLSLKKIHLHRNLPNSVTELFLNANWLEREAAELNNVFFYFKKDLRNLMLPYGDTSAPFKKIYPTIGTREIFYDANTDTLVQSPVTIQF